MNHNIIDKKRIEDPLPNSEFVLSAELVKHLADATPDIIFIMNIDTKELLYANRQFADILGYTDKQTHEMKSTIYDIMHPDDIPGMIDHVEKMRTAADGELRTIEYRLIDANGRTRWFIDRNAVFKRDINNVPVEKIGISHEITDDRQQKQEILILNEELERKNTELNDLNAELNKFFYVASHDLREPLRKAYNFLEMIMNSEAPNLTNAGRSFFRRAQGAIQRVNLITDDIIAFSQLNSEREQQPQIVDLKKILQQVIISLDTIIKNSRALITYDELPPIIGYEQLLYLLFYHLIDNGIKFSKLNTRPEIHINCTVVQGAQLSYSHFQGDKQYLELDFIDHGVGFQSKDSERIFNLFERIELASKVKGSGIGLAICKKIVAVHHGHIYASGTENKGATFTCILPLE